MFVRIVVAVRACVFCEILSGKGSASMVYSDARCTAFMDVRPANPGHELVVPNARAASLRDLPVGDGAVMFRVAQEVAAALYRSGLRCEGINLFLADGEVAGQEVFHVHLHPERHPYEFVPEARSFAVPDPVLPAPEAARVGRRHFDVVIASDFRLPGGTTSSNVEEIKAQRRMGLRTGLIQMSCYPSNPNLVSNCKIRNLIDGDLVQMLVYREKVSCDTLIVRHPPVLQEFQDAVPDVEASEVHVIMNQTPMRDYSDEGKPAYTIGRCEEHLQRHFGRSTVWHPTGPMVRGVLHRHHEEELSQITLAGDDWSDIIDVGEWRRESRPARGERPRIGRHSRDFRLKWPADPDEMIAAYPASGDYEVHVLGGAEAPRDLLGGLPDNWRVLEFGELRPKDFLSTLDVFVYYTHPDLVEAFGRTILEAMAVGVPTILPRGYREVFGKAAIYAGPHEVMDHINRLMADDDLYESQVETARAYVGKHFGYAKHAERLGKSLAARAFEDL